VADLGNAANAPLWLQVHTQMQDIATQLGGAVKPTGAGGGDLALGAFASAEAAALFTRRLADRGIPCPPLAPAHQGVRLQSQASKVGE
jgi:phosphomevalonate kinase